MKNNKPVLILAGAIAAFFVISLVIRFVALSELGLPGGWTLYFGLPVGGIGLLILLLRLGLLNFGQEPSATMRAFAARRCRRTRRGRGADRGADDATTAGDREPARQRRLSDDQYTAERARIIASL